MLAGQPFPVFLFLIFFPILSALHLEKKFRIEKLWPEKYYPVRYLGGKIYLNIRESSMERARAMGAHEAAKMALIQKLLRPGMTFLDIGAHKGYFSLLAAKLMNDQGAIYAFEPNSDNCGWLEKSIALNGYTSINVVPIALADRNETRHLFTGKKSGHHSLVYDQGLGRTSVTVRRLDDFLKERGVQRVDIIKIDVEGVEVEVLRGATELLASIDPKIVIDVNNTDRPRLFDILFKFGFRLFDYSSPDMKIISREEFLNNQSIKEVLAEKRSR